MINTHNKGLRAQRKANEKMNEIKNQLIRKEVLLMVKYFYLTQKYRENICSKCMGAEQQIKRECGLFKGHLKPACKIMTKNIDKKMKKENKKLMQKIISFTISSDAQLEV